MGNEQLPRLGVSITRETVARDLGSDTIVDQLVAGDVDTLDFTGFTPGFTPGYGFGIDLDIEDIGAQSVAAYLGLTLSDDDGIERVWGTAYADTIRGNALANELRGYGGVDHLFGRAGADTLYGGTEMDYLYGDAGDDWLYGEEGGDDYLMAAATCSAAAFGACGVTEPRCRPGRDIVAGGAKNRLTRYGGLLQSGASTYSGGHVVVLCVARWGRTHTRTSQRRVTAIAEANER